MSSLYKDTITIYKRVQGALDSNGNPTFTKNTATLTNQPCRLYFTKRTEIVEQKLIVKEVQKVMFDYNSAWVITEGDFAKVNNINYEITKAPIISGSNTPHHYEFELKRMQGE